MFHRLASIALACLAAFPAAAQQLDQRLDAVREFKRFFPTYSTTAERVAAVQTLEGMECPEAVAALVALLDTADGDVRTAVLGVLSSYRRPASFAELLSELPTMKDQERRASIIEVLGNARLAQAVAPLGDIALNDKRASPAVRYEVARALGKIGRADGAPVLAVLLGDKEAIVRLAAADAVAALRLRDLAPAVVALLDDSEWQVRSAAVRALGVLRHEAAVPRLIEMMTEEGRLAEEAAEALFSITALDFGTDAEVWAAQWEKLQAIGWRIPTDEELTKAAESRKRSDTLYGKSSTTFAGIKTTSTRVLFVIDISGSMDDLVVERDRFGPGYHDFAKLSIVKTELARAIETLGANVFFNIVAFATDLKPWKKHLVAANIVNKSSALAWVERLAPIGGADDMAMASAGLSPDLAAGKTNTFKALMYPFGVDPGQPAPTVFTQGKASFKNKLDTVFFLSDGRPSTGKLVDTGEILAEVKRLNEVFRIVIHSIAIGDFRKDFLRELAEQSGGTFVDLGR